MIIRKSRDEIETMGRAGRVVARTLELLGERAKPGVTTAELDEAAEEYIRSEGGVPTFKGYRGFPAAICTSPNSMVVHGIPGPYVLEDGDLISVDVGVTLDGFVADSAFTFPVGVVDGELVRHLEVEDGEELTVDLLEHAVERLGLGDGAWEAVENEPV